MTTIARWIGGIMIILSLSTYTQLDDIYGEDELEEQADEIISGIAEKKAKTYEETAPSESRLSFYLNPWVGNLSATTFRGDAPALAGTKFSIDEVGIDRTRFWPWFGATLKITKLDMLGIDVWGTSGGGNKVLSKNIDFDGFTFAAGDPVTSDIFIGHISVYYERSLVMPDEAPERFYLSWVLGASVLAWSLKLHDTNPQKNFAGQEKIWMLLPRSGLKAEKRFKIGSFPVAFRMGGFLEWIPKISKFRGHNFDIYLEVKIYLARALYLGGGYRYLTTSMSNEERTFDTDTASFTVHGPYITLGVDF
ncbi:MAG: hypothetical protein ACK4NF_04715 [Planctomycetota bacterium]